MTKVYLRGPQRGATVPISVTALSQTKTATATSFQRPLPQTALPTISDAFDGFNLSVDTSNFTGPFTYDWRVVGGATFATSVAPTFAYTLAVALTGDNVTSVVVNEAITSDVPASGSLIIKRSDGSYKLITYDNWSVSTFTTSDPTNDYGGGAADGLVGAHVGVLTGVGGSWIECAVTHSAGTTVSLPVMLYGSVMMGAPMMGSHIADDAAVLTIVPQSDVTHYAVGDGDWSDGATWNTGQVPGFGAFAYIPRGRTVTYDEPRENIQLDRIRVDGALNWALDQTTEMLVETFVSTRGSTVTIGTNNANRLPAIYNANITISGANYDALTYTPTNMKASRFTEARGWERGFLVQGVGRFWGAHKLTWAKANPIEAGATSLTMREAPVGWSVGDWIVIGGTDIDVDGVGLVLQDEERQITGISGNVVSWDTPLVHPHKNQLSTSTRTDLYPNVLAKGNKNIRFRSKVTSPNWRRGHFVYMHHHCTVDLWGSQFVSMGRTDKDIPAGVQNSNNEFRYMPNGEDFSYPADEEPLTPESNLQSRYSLHLHHVGFNHMGPRPIVKDCYVEDAPGWSVVHHSCDADFQKIAIYKFHGGGLVSEQGNELGAWVDCLAMHTTKVTGTTPETRPKVRSGNAGLAGDTFRHGYAFCFRGRAMRTNRCVANSCAWGHVFYHRTNGAEQTVVPAINPKRSLVDIKDAGMITLGGDYRDDEWLLVTYPIIHFADNEAVAVIGGFTVTKSAPQQQHDVNIRLKRFKAWGFKNYGAAFEYIGVYLLDQFDLIAGQSGAGTAIAIASEIQTYQIGIINCRAEGTECFQEMGYAFSNGYMSLDDPKYYTIGYDMVDVGSFQVTTTDGLTPGTPDEDCTLIVEDYDGSFIDYDLNASETYPLVIASLTSGGAWDVRPTNADGNKIDNISAVGEIMPKRWGNGSGTPLADGGEAMMIGGAGAFTTIRIAETIVDKWTYGGRDAMAFTDLISERTTARPTKVTKLIDAPSGTALNNAPTLGAFVYGANPTTADNITQLVTQDGSVVINVPVASNAAGGDGVTYELDDRDRITCDNGIAELDTGTGELTYTPDRDFLGTDEMYVFVKSGHRFATVRINFLITPDGTDSGLTTPVVDTHFAASDAGGNTITLECFDPPSTSYRGIKRTEYSTDSGESWRRLCQGWVKAQHEIKHPSNSAALQSAAATLTAGTQNVMIRYLTYYDFDTSTPSGNDTVTVTV